MDMNTVRLIVEALTAAGALGAAGFALWQGKSATKAVSEAVASNALTRDQMAENRETVKRQLDAAVDSNALTREQMTLTRQWTEAQLRPLIAIDAVRPKGELIWATVRNHGGGSAVGLELELGLTEGPVLRPFGVDNCGEKNSRHLAALGSGKEWEVQIFRSRSIQDQNGVFKLFSVYWRATYTTSYAQSASDEDGIAWGS